ncbi:hypothetical protein TWF694_005676 [Orbilia ellipsospora]|uniref:Uncharacterized protein n=1 Tax=Orbilia ellipsospora TaxID=2528407 RepID=A0AAV9WRY0_9PEZI
MTIVSPLKWLKPLLSWFLIVLNLPITSKNPDIGFVTLPLGPTITTFRNQSHDSLVTELRLQMKTIREKAWECPISNPEQYYVSDNDGKMISQTSVERPISLNFLLQSLQVITNALDQAISDNEPQIAGFQDLENAKLSATGLDNINQIAISVLDDFLQAFEPFTEFGASFYASNLDLLLWLYFGEIDLENNRITLATNGLQKRILEVQNALDKGISAIQWANDAAT